MVNELKIIGTGGVAEHYLRRELESASRPESASGFTAWILPEYELHPDDFVKSALGELPKEVTNVVLLSSEKVYARDGGEAIGEDSPAPGDGAIGRGYARAEDIAKRWAREHGANLAIVRAASIFGTGMRGEMDALFERVAAGRFIHIRGNVGKLSAVTGYDAAKALLGVAGNDGVYNLSDGRAHDYVKLAEAMTANAGARRRMPCIPKKWGNTIYTLFRFVPWVSDALGPEAMEADSSVRVLSNAAIKEAMGIEFFDTLQVIARTATDFPYDTK